MNEPMIQLLVLAGIAVFLILRLKSVLGTREGFEKPPVQQQPDKQNARRGFEVIDGGPDHDITDHVAEDSEQAQTLAAMKRVEPSFSVSEFVQGARGAYEMIVMGFEKEIWTKSSLSCPKRCLTPSFPLLQTGKTRV